MTAVIRQFHHEVRASVLGVVRGDLILAILVMFSVRTGCLGEDRDHVRTDSACADNTDGLQQTTSFLSLASARRH